MKAPPRLGSNNIMNQLLQDKIKDIVASPKKKKELKELSPPPSP